MQIGNTKKINLSEKSFIKKKDFFLKGKYCYYVAPKKIKSIEAIIDTIASDAVFVFENLKQKEISIVLSNSLQNSIVFNIEKNFSWEKFNSVLKTILIQHPYKHAYLLEESKIKHKIDIPMQEISLKQFNQIAKKIKVLATKKTYLLKDIVFLIIGGIFFVAQNYYFSQLEEKNTQIFYQEKNALQNEIRHLQVNITKTKNIIKVLPHQIAKSYNDIVAFKKKKSKKRKK